MGSVEFSSFAYVWPRRSGRRCPGRSARHEVQLPARVRNGGRGGARDSARSPPPARSPRGAPPWRAAVDAHGCRRDRIVAGGVGRVWLQGRRRSNPRAQLSTAGRAVGSGGAAAHGAGGSARSPPTARRVRGWAREYDSSPANHPDVVPLRTREARGLVVLLSGSPPIEDAARASAAAPLDAFHSRS